MLDFPELMTKIKLFEGIAPADLKALLACLDAKPVNYEKNSFILSAGDPVENVGILLDGQLHIIREDYNGGRELLTVLSPGDLFAETLCCAGIAESPVSVLADSDCRVLLFQFQRILRTCPSSCTFHAKLIQNMLHVMAAKNLMLQTRMELLSKKTIRARLIGYLESFAMHMGNDFAIPLNREELADYLSIDRSALSRELGRLKDEGVIDFHKNKFRFL